MFSKIISKGSILHLISLTAAVLGLFEQCNHTLDLEAGHKIFINSPFYPNPYPAGTSCRYTLTAPRDYQLEFKCYIEINATLAVSSTPLTKRCYDEIFYFNHEGSELLSGSEYFCGSGSMERKSFLNRAVISYISMRPPRGQFGVKGATKVGVQREGVVTTDANVPKRFNVTNNKSQKLSSKTNTTHYGSTVPLPTFSTPSTHLDISNAFAYLLALFANRIETSAFMAPSADKSQKNKKCKCNLHKAPKSKRGVVKPAVSAIAIPTKTAEITSAPEIAKDLKASSQKATDFEQRYSRIVTYQQTYDGYPGGMGKGRFSCLVEAVKAQCDCGWSINTLKVVSGASVSGVHEFASMAGVLTLKYGKIFCGAVIISHHFLLSAAHCFISAATNRPELLQVVVGEHDLSTVFESVYTRYYDIDAIILHENFRATGKQVSSDIAILRTRQTIEWNRGVAPACLPFRSLAVGDDMRKPPVAGQRVETAGWGSLTFGGPQSQLLHTALLDVIGVEECRSALGAVPPATFCTFTPGRDTCQYDSGGGLYLREGGRIFVVGIVSYGYGCATHRPSVNTKVASYIRWIKSQTSQVAYCIK